MRVLKGFAEEEDSNIIAKKPSQRRRIANPLPFPIYSHNAYENVQ